MAWLYWLLGGVLAFVGAGVLIGWGPVVLLTLAAIAVVAVIDITQPPEGFVGGDYPARYGDAPSIANYLFFPHPAASNNTFFFPAPKPHEFTGGAWENNGL